MRARNVIGTLCCILGVVGCSAKEKEAISTSQPKNRYIEMDAASRTNFTRALEVMHMGDDYDKITNALGKPDQDEVLQRKEGGPLGAFIARSLIYYVNQSNGQRVVLWLDHQDRLRQVFAEASGIPSRSSNIKDLEQTNPYLRIDFFEMDAAKQARFRRSLQEIKVGDGYEKIVTALGNPDHDRALASKDGKQDARSLLYYFKRWQKDLVAEGKDQFVDLQLDANNQLVGIVSNAEGIPSRPTETR